MMFADDWSADKPIAGAGAGTVYEALGGVWREQRSNHQRPAGAKTASTTGGSRKGIVERCCRKSCSYSVLLEYCGTDCSR